MKKNACNVKLYESKYQKRKRRKAWFLLFLFVFIVGSCFAYVFCVVNPIVVEAVKSSVFSLSTSAVSDAVYDVLQEENVSYKDLVSYEQIGQDNVVLVSLQTVTINKIARRFYQVAQEYLDEMGEIGVDVNLGAFTGLPFLVGVGPKINLKMTPIGAMTSTFESKFESAGINQTKHTLFIRLFASVSLILPAFSKTIDSVTEMLVVEDIIAGKVPEFYFSNSGVLDFTPSA